MKCLLPFFLLFIAAAYPDPKLTPGEILTQDAKTVCVAGYSQTVRHTSAALKNKIYKNYHALKKKGSCCEADHLVSLELGGADTEKNLWPQSYPDAYHKDKIENYLHREVCAGRMDLKEAQAEIYHWEEIYNKQHQK